MILARAVFLPSPTPNPRQRFGFWETWIFLFRNVASPDGRWKPSELQFPACQAGLRHRDAVRTFRSRDWTNRRNPSKRCVRDCGRGRVSRKCSYRTEPYCIACHPLRPLPPPGRRRTVSIYLVVACGKRSSRQTLKKAEKACWIRLD